MVHHLLCDDGNYDLNTPSQPPRSKSTSDGYGSTRGGGIASNGERSNDGVRGRIRASSNGTSLGITGERSPAGSASSTPVANPRYTQK